MGARYGIESVHGKANSENIPRDYGTEQKCWVGMMGLKNPIGTMFSYINDIALKKDNCHYYSVKIFLLF